MKENIYVFYGGKTLEHEVSITSAKTVINQLNREKYNAFGVYVSKEGFFSKPIKFTKPIDQIDELISSTNTSIADSFVDFLNNSEKFIAFPVIHGTYGEDGVLQGLFECLDVPYVGCNVCTSSLCMDKGFTNDILHAHNISQAKYYVLEKNLSYNLDRIIEDLAFPIYVKPCNAGSSVGVTKADSLEELEKGIQLAFSIDKRIVLEECVNGVELQIAVMGTMDPKVSRLGIYRLKNHLFFDYDAKYKDDTTELVIPYECGEPLETQARELAKKTYSILGCEGLSRVDIFIRAEDQKLLVNEVNTLPGMTDHSLFPRLWSATTGQEFSEIIDELIENAKSNYAQRKSLLRDRI